MTSVYVQIFSVIQWTIAFLFKILNQDCPNVPNLFIHRYYFTEIAAVNWTVQLDKQEFKLSANIRYVYVLGDVLVTYNLMLNALAYASSTGPTNPEEVLNPETWILMWDCESWLQHQGLVMQFSPTLEQ